MKGDNTMEGLSLSDIAAVTRDNEGMFGSNGGMWIFALLILLLIGNGGLFGGRGGEFGQFATAASQSEILIGQQFQNLDNKIDRLANGLCDSTYALNNSILGEGRAIQTQLANCCCENQRNTDALRYDMAQQFAAANAVTTAQTQKILDVMCQNKIEALQSKINSLELAQATGNVVRYPNAWTYNAGASPFCNNGCNYGCSSI